MFLTHYIRYYGIKTSDNLRVTSYCDSESLLKNEESFHTRDVDSSSWYLKSDHDVIMKLSSVQGLPFELISRHVKSHQDDKYEYDDLTRPEQLNVQADHRASDALDELLAAGEIPSSTRYLLAEATCATVPGILPVAKSTRSEPNSLSTSSERLQRRNNWSDEVYDSTSAGLLTDQPAPNLATVNGHLWSN
jgi:hypothetical protein